VGSQQWPIPPAELRRRRAKSLYEIEMFFREEGLSVFVYDEENDLFRFEDGRFAFSRTQADVTLLEERATRRREPGPEIHAANSRPSAKS
jgi:hypothetical protein